MGTRISQLDEAPSIDGSEMVEVAKLSATVTITASTISALASDNSFNDSADGFLAANFAVGQTVKVTGFTGNVVNNIESAKITSLTASKMTIGGVDGNVIVDDAEGESVTITKWDTKRAATADVGSAGASVAVQVVAAAAKTTLVDADSFGVVDSADSNALKEVTALNIRNYVLGGADALVYKGAIDCSSNPNYPAADAGHVYRVSVAGKIGGGSGPNVEVGDRLTCNTDGTSAGTHAAVGANWDITQVNIDGAVVGPASSTSGNLASFSGTGGKTVQDSGIAAANVATSAANIDDNTLVRGDGGTRGVQKTGIVVDDDNKIHGYRASPQVISGTTGSITVSDTGKVVDTTNGSAVAIEFDNAIPVDACGTVMQLGAGQITFSVESGGTLRNRQSHTKCAGQYGVVLWRCISNSGGTAAEILIGGDTAI